MSNEEIKPPLFEMGENKCSGPYGFNMFFFKSAWSIIGIDVIREVQFVFRRAYLNPRVNAINIYLIPKV